MRFQVVHHNHGTFPSYLLETVRPDASLPVSPETVAAFLQGQLPTSFAESLKMVMKSLLAQQVFDIESVAELIDSSPRTLQRQLKQEQTSYRQLLDSLRYGTAMQKVAHSPLEIRAIAQELGYSTPGHFTRAFKRWSGKSPSQLRQESGGK